MTELHHVTNADKVFGTHNTPDHFRVDDLPQIHALMRAKPFATLVADHDTAKGLKGHLIYAIKR
jgi:hypothetical protein